MLKRLALVVAVILAFSLVGEKSLIFNIEGDYTFYLNSASSNAKIITVSYDDAKEIKKSLKNVCGESVTTTSKEEIEKEIQRLNAQLVFSEKVDNIIINYYYSDKISAYKTINGHKINLQTAINENIITIGSPIIFGSF